MKVSRGTNIPTTATTPTDMPLDEAWPWLPRAKAWLEPNDDGEMTALYVECVFCGDLHRHGGAPLQEGQTHWGMRLSHCLWGECHSYLLVPAPEGEPKPQGFSSRERQRRLREDDHRRGISPTGPKFY